MEIRASEKTVFVGGADSTVTKVNYITIVTTVLSYAALSSEHIIILNVQKDLVDMFGKYGAFTTNQLFTYK